MFVSQIEVMSRGNLSILSYTYLYIIFYYLEARVKFITVIKYLKLTIRNLIISTTLLYLCELSHLINGLKNYWRSRVNVNKAPSGEIQ